jgi:beta-phosphoglucomutase-like phosphatase (HAD superfamily)
VEEIHENEIEYLKAMIKQKLEEKQKLLQEKEKREKTKLDTTTPYGDLEDLIVKWRIACQEALIDLQKKVASSSQNIKMQQMLAHFHIDEKLIQFDKEAEDFY